LFAEFEQRLGTPAQLARVLHSSVKYCPRAEVLWLMVAKETWKHNGVGEARDVLTRAFQANPDSEAILLAAAKVETEVGEVDRARTLLAKARKVTPSARVYMKSALLERRNECPDAEHALLEEGLERFPDAPKLWLMLAQRHERWQAKGTAATAAPVKVTSADGSGGEGEATARGDGAARTVYTKALRLCAKDVPLWCGLARLEERNGKPTKARAVLERGRQACRGERDVDQLWEESVRVEVRAGGNGAGQSVLARGLKECGSSGRLWALAIALEPRARQRARSVDALKRCDQNAHVLVEAAKLLWREQKIGQAREWLNRAVKVDADYGDALATLYAFEQRHGTRDRLAVLEERAESNGPKYGALWTRVSKRPGNESLSVLDVLRAVAATVSHTALA
jgi:pre-mRNA-processing factor 6